ncbi:MAG: hypothetical protein GTN78_25835 [Gemmatimonadales bacterium]|nr:hypothetical protein [Gemmatimonadales bacterium]NIN12581.1 hypothetical protein [Gemmatimonadales bacterium]NIR03576.1 hypothetical protein [Gemmatimonadales bacterium]NIS65898.1 hypothetical protein [Gemmatimonadales bacterium]
MSWGLRWTILLLAVALADFGIRFATGFDVVWVVRAEAILFLGTALALWGLHRRRPPQVRWQFGLQQILAAAFALAGLRAALWAGGLPVAAANLVVLVVGVLLVGLGVVRSRRKRAAV